MKLYQNGDFDSIAAERRYYERESDYDTWLEWYKKCEYYRYQSARATIDCCIFTYDKNEPVAKKALKVLLLKRPIHPYRGEWGLPGAFIYPSDLTAEDSVWRMMRDKLCFTNSTLPLEQLGSFTARDRDPRARVIAINYAVYLSDAINLPNVIDKPDIKWVAIEDALSMKLAFDSNLQLAAAMDHVCGQFGWRPLVMHTLPIKFTIDDALRLRCGVFGEDLLTGKSRENFKQKFKHIFSEVGVVDADNPRSPKVYTLKDDVTLYR